MCPVCRESGGERSGLATTDRRADNLITPGHPFQQAGKPCERSPLYQGRNYMKL